MVKDREDPYAEHLVIETALKKYFTDQEIKLLQERLADVEWADRVRTRSDYVAVLDGCYFDEKVATRFEQFCEKFIIQVTGRYRGRALVLFPWQKEVFRDLFGWLRPDGTRRFKYLYLSVPKKQGKTSITAALALYMLMADGESNAQCYMAANDRAQAGICFNNAANYVKASPNLSKYLQVIPSTKRITYERKYSFIHALSRETCTSDGIDASLVVYDELHLAKNREMFETLRYAGAARLQPLFIVITTAGSELDSVCGKEYQLFKKVLSGEVVDISLLPAIFEASVDDDPSDPEVWAEANPSLGLIINEEDVRDAYNQAIETGMLGNFKRRRLNIWAKDASYWMAREKWEKCIGSFPSLEELEDCPCWLGLDLADQIDINALVAVWKTPECYYIKPWFWCPEETIPVRCRETSIPYQQWVSEGWLLTTEGAVTDYEVIYEFIIDLSQRVQLQSLCYDPWQVASIANRLETVGLDCVKIPQVISHLSEPMKALERMVRNKEIVHDGSPVMTWMVSNVVTKSDPNNNIRPDRKRSKEKIDGVASLITALARVIVAEEESELYEGIGIAIC